MDKLNKDFNELKQDVNAVIDKAVKFLAEPILECKDSKDFLKMLAKLGDKAYDGNKLAKKIKFIPAKLFFKMSESFDRFVFGFILKFIDKSFLKKHLGKDWFIKLQNKARISTRT
jgi:hypothetical protein